jgi:hypothetical protein
MVKEIISDLKKRDILNSTLIISLSGDVINYARENFDEKYISWVSRGRCIGNLDEPCQISATDFLPHSTSFNTGLVFYVYPETFLENFAYQVLPSMTNEMNRYKANYLVINAANVKKLNYLQNQMPKINQNLIFWYLDDEMFVYIPESKREKSDQGIKEICAWWCDSKLDNNSFSSVVRIN